jgi:metal-responsive CopG/Arc/MetJ family transcriptional regulator
MKKATVSNIRKKRIGRPPVGAEPVMVRMPPNLLKELDKWKRRDSSRPEAIRHLVETALTSKLSMSAEQHAAIRDWIASNEPGLSLHDAIDKLVAIALKRK